jgi:hypothetical protein
MDGNTMTSAVTSSGRKPIIAIASAVMGEKPIAK